jgi:hypothetical protein
VAITYQSAGALAYSASADAATIAPAYPASIVAGDMLVLIVGFKPTVANTGSFNDPAGWTAVTSLLFQGGYSTTLGADTGNTSIGAWTKLADGTESGSLTVTITGANVAWGQILRVTSTAGDLTSTGATGADTSAGNVSITIGSIQIANGDLCIGAMCIPTDITTPAQFSAEALSLTGTTFGTATEISEPDSSIGNDIGGFIFRVPATAGTGSGTPTMTATAGGTTTNVRGPGLIVRLRESGNHSAYVSQTVTAAVTAVADVPNKNGNVSQTITAAAVATANVTGSGVVQFGTSPARATNTGSAATTASFTPQANSLLVAVVATGAVAAPITTAVTDSLSGSWTLILRYNTNEDAATEVWMQDVGASPAARTVTSTASGAVGLDLSVVNFTGAADVATHVSTAAKAGTGATSLTRALTPTASQGYIVGAISYVVAGQSWTANAATSIAAPFGTTNDGTNGCTHAEFISANRTVATVAQTLGFTNTAVATNGVVVEILGSTGAKTGDVSQTITAAATVTAIEGLYGNVSQTVTAAVTASASVGGGGSKTGDVSQTITAAATVAGVSGDVGNVSQTITAGATVVGVKGAIAGTTQTVTAAVTAAGVSGDVGNVTQTVTAASTVAAQTAGFANVSQTITAAVTASASTTGAKTGDVSQTITAAATVAAIVARTGDVSQAITAGSIATAVVNRYAVVTLTQTAGVVASATVGPVAAVTATVTAGAVASAMVGVYTGTTATITAGAVAAASVAGGAKSGDVAATVTASVTATMARQVVADVATSVAASVIATTRQDHRGSVSQSLTAASTVAARAGLFTSVTAQTVATALAIAVVSHENTYGTGWTGVGTPPGSRTGVGQSSYARTGRGTAPDGRAGFGSVGTAYDSERDGD